MSLFAVHIADGVLGRALWIEGSIGLAVLLALSSRKLRDDEIPTLALLTAAFFVASLIHVKLPGTSVHLLLNGLLGMILGWRCVLAITLGLFLQALLFAHGGLTSLGINGLILAGPALVGRGVLDIGETLGWLHSARRRVLLGGAIGFLVGLLTLVTHFIVLAFGSLAGEDLVRLAQFDFIAHLPVLAIETFITGVTLDFLWRVKPSIFGLERSAARRG